MSTRNRQFTILVCLLFLLSLLPWGALPAPTAAAGSNPFAGIQWTSSSGSPVRTSANTYLNSLSPGERAAKEPLVDVVRNQQIVEWFGDWCDGLNPGFCLQANGYLDSRLNEIINEGGTPIIALYAVPQRDCGQFSAGNNITTEAEYVNWIDRVATRIGTRKVIVLLEPDGVSVTFCLNNAQLQARLRMIKDALTRLKRDNPNIAVYLDAGNETTPYPYSELATRLITAGLADAQGFFVNSTTNYYTTAEASSGKLIIQEVKKKNAALDPHFVIDTSRNGRGPYINPNDDLAWCNAPGRAIGVPPSTKTADPVIDAFIWLKPLWESDGACRPGAPATGQPYWSYTLDMVARSLSPFVDLPSDPTEREKVRYLILLGVIRGYNDTNYGPNDKTTRSQMAALIARPVYWDLEDWGSPPFNDRQGTDDNLWRNVGTLAHYNVALGYGNRTYGPHDEVLHYQVLLFLGRAMIEKGFWTKETVDDPTIFPDITNLPLTDRLTLVTFAKRTAPFGGIPGHPANAPFGGIPGHPANAPFGDPNAPALRQWFALVVYVALQTVWAQQP